MPYLGHLQGCITQHPAVCIRYLGRRLDLHVNIDSDWGSKKDTRRSLSLRLQPIVTVSSMETKILHASMLSRISCGSVSFLRTLTWVAPDRLTCSSQLIRSSASNEPSASSAVEAYRHQVPLDLRYDEVCLVVFREELHYM